MASQLEALIDFADEDLPAHVETTLRQQTATLITDIATILDDNRAGELTRDGVVVVLVGPVNAGKSTILNGLAGGPPPSYLIRREPPVILCRCGLIYMVYQHKF